VNKNKKIAGHMPDRMQIRRDNESEISITKPAGYAK